MRGGVIPGVLRLNRKVGPFGGQVLHRRSETTGSSRYSLRIQNALQQDRTNRKSAGQIEDGPKRARDKELGRGSDA